MGLHCSSSSRAVTGDGRKAVTFFGCEVSGSSRGAGAGAGGVHQGNTINVAIALMDCSAPPTAVSIRDALAPYQRRTCESSPSSSSFLGMASTGQRNSSLPPRGEGGDGVGPPAQRRLLLPCAPQRRDPLVDGKAAPQALQQNAIERRFAVHRRGRKYGGLFAARSSPRRGISRCDRRLHRYRIARPGAARRSRAASAALRRNAAGTSRVRSIRDAVASVAYSGSQK